MTFTLTPPAAGVGQTAQGPMTPIRDKRYETTYAAPTSDPFGRSRNECWGATSVDGDWDYTRVDDGLTTPWMVTYGPTGQTREGYASLSQARQDTAGPLLRQFRTAAVLATRDVDPRVRADGQRWQAAHIRMAGGTEVEYRCRCGGYLAQISSDGRLGHIDACVECVEDLDTSTCDHVAEHLFCGDPEQVRCAHGERLGCTRPALPNQGKGCPLDNADDCCTGCCADIE